MLPSESKHLKTAERARERQTELRSEVAFAIFGGLKVTRPPVDISTRPPRERLILARLVIAQGTPVSASELVDTLWEVDPPPTAVNQIHRHIGELRRLLEPELPSRASGRYVLAVGDGYRLSDSLSSSDLADVTELGREAVSAEPSEAVDLYAQILAIVVDPPLPEFPWSVMERPEFAAIQRQRISIAVDAAECALIAGVTPAIVSAVEVIASGAPLDERLQSRLIALLHRAGRRADAIHVFETTRSALLGELAIPPGPELLDAIRAVLSDDGDPSLDVPIRLPALPASLVTQGQFDSIVADATANALAGKSALLTVSGMAGIGKTTLAVAWGREAAHRFPDGQLFVDLQGFDRSGRRLSTSDALGRLLEDLGVSLAGVDSRDEVRREMYLTIMKNKRMVVILDNASDADQVRSLLPDSPGSLVIVTSRQQLSRLVVRNGAVSVPLSRWSAKDSRDLLIGRLGSARVAAAGDAVDSIIASCAGLPLALALAAAASAARADSGVEDVATRLAATASALDVLALDASDDLRSTFDWSLQTVTPDAATLFDLASLHPGPQFAVGALAVLADQSLEQSRRAATELSSANLLVRVSDDRYSMHDLLRIYSAERAAQRGDVDLAKERLIRYFVHSTREAYLSFGRPPVVDLLGVEQSSVVEHFESPEQAIGWFVAERRALVAVFHGAISNGLDREAALLALDWRPMIQSVDSPQAILPLTRAGTEASVRLGNHTLEAELRRDLGSQLGMCGEQEQAVEEIGKALTLYRELGDLVGVANAYRNLAQMVTSNALMAEYSTRAVQVARESGDQITLANALFAFITADLVPRQSWQEAFAVSTEILGIIDAHGPEYLRPYARGYLAVTLVELGNHAQALHEAEEMGKLLDPTLKVMHAVITARAWAGLGDRQKALHACDLYDQLMTTYSEYFRTRDDVDPVGSIGEVRAQFGQSDAR